MGRGYAYGNCVVIDFKLFGILTHVMWAVGAVWTISGWESFCRLLMITQVISGQWDAVLCVYASGEWPS
jgi:hypothetical protein